MIVHSISDNRAESKVPAARYAGRRCSILFAYMYFVSSIADMIDSTIKEAGS